MSVTGPSSLVHGLVSSVRRETAGTFRSLVRSRRVLVALTYIECQRKYAGSILGLLWYPLYSLLLLTSYCFIYLVVFRIRYPAFGTYGFVLFVFSGLIPFLGFSEAVTTGQASVKANIALLRNAVFPIEFIPVKHVLSALVGLLTSLAILVVMILPTRYFGWHLAYLPVAMLSLLTFSLAVVWVLSAVAVIVPDVAQVVNILLLLLIFISPIAFSIDMVPERVRPFIYLNPLSFLIEAFRYSLIGVRSSPFWHDGAMLLGSALAASLAVTFFRRISPVFSDYE